MFDNGISLALKIKREILTRFAHAGIDVSFDKARGEYFISTRNRELYYSKEYGTLIMEISRHLWDRDVFDFYFTLDTGTRETAKTISFSLESEVGYKPWHVDMACPRLPVDNHVDAGDIALAA